MASDNKTYDCDAVTLHYASDIYAPHPKVMTINIDPPRPIHRAINFYRLRKAFDERIASKR